jgi:RNA polymerase sigma-70 factor (ECF subfamily)
MTTDEALMLDFQRGSRAAFEELFARYQGPLYGFFRRRLPDQERADDLVQETFLAVIGAQARYEPRALVRTYFYGIALKLVSSERRKQAKETPPTETELNPDADLGPEPAVTDATDTVLWVRQALEKLEAMDREVLMLREYEQLTYAEIAHLLRIPVNTVRSRLFRARMALKESLQPESRTRSAVIEIDKAASSGAMGISKANPAESEA